MAQLVFCNDDTCVHNQSGITCMLSQIDLEVESFIDCLSSRIVQQVICKKYKGNDDGEN